RVVVDAQNSDAIGTHQSCLPSQRPKSGVAGFPAIRRSGDAYFCARTYLAPNIELRTDVFRPPPHPSKTPVRIPCLLDGFSLNAAAVVTNQHAQEVAQVLNLDFDVYRFGMTQRVHDRFPANKKELLLNCRVQLARRSLNENPNFCALPGCDFANELREGLL